MQDYLAGLHSPFTLLPAQEVFPLVNVESA